MEHMGKITSGGPLPAVWLHREPLEFWICEKTWAELQVIGYPLLFGYVVNRQVSGALKNRERYTCGGPVPSVWLHPEPLGFPVRLA